MGSILPETSENLEKSLSGILKPLLKHIANHLYAEGSLILMRDPETEMYLVIAGDEDIQPGRGSVVRANDDMVGRVGLNRQPLIINNYREWAGRNPELDYKQLSLNAYLCVPLVWNDQYIGGLVVSSSSTSRQFTPEDIPELELFSPIISFLLKDCSPQAFHPSLETELRKEMGGELNDLREARQRMAEDADQLRAILADTVAIQEEERSRIAHDLHDGSNQIIVGALYEIQVAQQRLANGRYAQISESLQAAKELLRKIEEENREIINDLRPPMLNNHGLGVTLKWYLDNFSTHHGFESSFEIEGTPRRFTNEIEISIFRIVQESLNNSLKHAQAHQLHIGLDFQPTFLLVTVQDDGRGFYPRKQLTDNQSKFGLIGMRERALSIGAYLEIRSAPGEGTRLTLQIPLMDNPDDPLGRMEQRHSFRVAYTSALDKDLE
jgi:signal transduction histidine kinase